MITPEAKDRVLIRLASVKLPFGAYWPDEAAEAKKKIIDTFAKLVGTAAGLASLVGVLRGGVYPSNPVV